MNKVIYNPLEEFEGKFKSLHENNTTKFFNDLVKRSGVDIEENRKTVKEYIELTENLKKLKRKRMWLSVLRVVLFITIILIPLAILKVTPSIKKLREEISQADKKAKELLDKAWGQMSPLNSLFTNRDALNLIEKTTPLVKFDLVFDAKKEADMKINYDFSLSGEGEESTLDVLSGDYNGNPFLFENKLVHRMGMETYHGYKTIHWTERVRDANGKSRTVSRSQTLHATVTKPKPFYSTQVVLNYCAQGGPDLCFTRDATHLHRKSEREIERYVKRGEKKLKRKTDKAIEKGHDFVSMSNTDFEVLFDALDRNDEVQYRTLFTPLAQTNMVDILLSKTGYGDDFNFIKRKRTNTIVSNHSQAREINLMPDAYVSYSFDIIEQNFKGKNAEFFKAVYFDFAPILAIPIYQESPINSLKPIPDDPRLYAFKECEALANALSLDKVVHPRTRTKAILKSEFVNSKDGVEKTSVTAFSYDIEKRVDVVSMLGGDGRVHSVPVEWDEYLPLTHTTDFYISSTDLAKGKNTYAQRNGICIYN